jgi:hypothetical protein
MPERKPKLRLLAPTATATPEEAAAIVAAIERFIRATASAPAPAPDAAAHGWRATAIVEGVARDPCGGSQSTSLPDPWINT